MIRLLRALHRRNEPSNTPVLRRAATSNIVKTILAVALLAYLIYLVDLRDILETARTADPRFVLAALLLLPLNVLIEGGLWHRITRLVVDRPSKRASFGSLMSGYALGFFTPGRIGELAGRSFYLPHSDKWSLSALVMFQRMIDMLVGVTIGLIGLSLFIYLARPEPGILWFAFLGGGIVSVPGILFVLVYPRPALRFLSRIIRKKSVLAPIAFLNRVNPRNVSPLLLFATARYLTFVGQFVLLIYAFGGSGAVPYALMGASMTFYGKYLIPSVTIMDIGVREGSAVFFMGAAGFLHATAFNASLFVFFVNLAIPAALGIPFVMRLRISRKKERADDLAAAVPSQDLTEAR